MDLFQFRKVILKCVIVCIFLKIAYQLLISGEFVLVLPPMQTLKIVKVLKYLDFFPFFLKKI